jgi:hypothetical protein
VKKIVIKTSRQGPDYLLIEMLNRLFPDCEIQILKDRDENLNFTDPILNQRVTPCKTNNDL